MKTNAELEQAIRNHPDDPKAYLVYADWLQTAGDPRGELIAVQHRLLERLLVKHRASLDRLAAQLLEKETLSRDELLELFAGLEPESRASETVGTVRALPS
jgi:uncharacterized protein (TIGR02996 family)